MAERLLSGRFGATGYRFESKILLKRDPDLVVRRSKDAMLALPLQPGFSAAALPIGRPDKSRGDSHSIFSAFRTNPREAVRQRSDEILLDDYRQGDHLAFEELVDRYRNELLHFLIRFLGSRAAAEDVFQETFLQIHLSAESFDIERRFRPWVFTIAANKARDYHRKNARRSALSLSGPVGGNHDDNCDFIDLLDADLPNPDAPILDSERSTLVKNVVDDLPLHLREILLLSYFQRMSYNQIADALEIPLGTVKSRLHSAVSAFARAWHAARINDKGVS